eukprot:357079-Chlamydomonas_euryale.AAC.4
MAASLLSGGGLVLPGLRCRRMTVTRTPCFESPVPLSTHAYSLPRFSRPFVDPRPVSASVRVGLQHAIEWRCARVCCACKTYHAGTCETGSASHRGAIESRPIQRNIHMACGALLRLYGRLKGECNAHCRTHLAGTSETSGRPSGRCIWQAWC